MPSQRLRLLSLDLAKLFNDLNHDSASASRRVHNRNAAFVNEWPTATIIECAHPIYFLNTETGVRARHRSRIRVVPQPPH